MTWPIAVGVGLFAFIVGTGFGILMTLIFVPTEQEKAVARERAYWHHPRGEDE